jgi:hypothetical protein
MEVHYWEEEKWNGKEKCQRKDEGKSFSFGW